MSHAWRRACAALLCLGSLLFGSAQAADYPPGVSIPGHKIVLNGVSYHVGDQGKGDRVVLLLHGMPDTSAVWRHQVKALVAAGYRVIVPDMLGYGETDKPQDPARYSGEKIIADMVALLDALKIDKVNLVGHDRGAFVSWELVLNLPDRVRRHVALSVGHPDHFLDVRSVAEVKESWFMYLNSQADAAALYAANDGAFYKKVIIPSHPERDEVWSRMKNPTAMTGSLNWDRANPMAGAYLQAATRKAEARRAKVSTLGVWSGGDKYLWEAQMKGTAPLMDAPWRYVRIKGASHWMMLDAPQETTRLLLDWLGRK